MIWNHVCVVIVMIVFAHCPSVVWPGIPRITTLSIYCVFVELLWIMLATLSIDHARCIRLLSSTGTMKHAISDCLIQKRILIWIGKLSGHDIVYLVCIQYPVVWMKPDEGMHVGKAALLELYCVDDCLDSSK